MLIMNAAIAFSIYSMVILGGKSLSLYFYYLLHYMYISGDMQFVQLFSLMCVSRINNCYVESSIWNFFLINYGGMLLEGH